MRIKIQEDLGLKSDDLYSMEIGETTAHHHCKQGYHNNRCHVTRKKSNLWLAHCKHCGVVGHLFLRKDDVNYKSVLDDLMGSKYISGKEYFTETSHLSEVDINEVIFDKTTHNTSVTISGGVTNKYLLDCVSDKLDLITLSSLVTNYGIQYDMNKIAIPVGTESHIAHNGFTIRYIYPSYNGPKYIDNTLGPNCYINEPNYISSEAKGCSDSLIITEDAMSAACASYFFGTRSLWLGGTTISSEQIQSIAHCSPRVLIIWLDDDNPQVIKNSVEVRSSLLSCGVNVTLCTATMPENYRPCVPKSAKDIFKSDWGHDSTELSWYQDNWNFFGTKAVPYIEHELSYAHS